MREIRADVSELLNLIEAIPRFVVAAFLRYKFS